MKTVVLYTSQAGSTKKYAEDLASYFKGDVFPLKKFKARNFKKYDTVVYGGWIQNGKIAGVDEFLSNWDIIKDKNVLMFAVGVSIPTKETRDQLINDNLLSLYHLRFYQLRGSFNLKNLKFPFSLVMKIVIKKLEKKPSASIEEKAFLELKNHPVDYYDYSGMDKIKDVFNLLSSKVL